MQRRVTSVLAVLALGVVPMSTAAAQETPKDDPARGLVFAGLGRSAQGRCGSLFEIVDEGRVLDCTHGPDPAPAGVDVRRPATAVPEGIGAVAGSSTICHGDGQSGYRVQLIYARASDVADRYNQFLSSFLTWAAQIDDIFSQSAIETGGTRHVQFVHDVACTPVVARVQLTPTGDDSFYKTVQQLRNQGYSRSDRKYLVWVDANVYCGIADMMNEDFPGESNIHNGSLRAQGMTARIDAGCWGQGGRLVEAHELAHTFGAVQASAPHATPNGHCTDDYDTMCYSDAPGVTVQVLCAAYFPSENRLDCNHDDYFHTNPVPGSYLDTHWNPATIQFLSHAGTTSVTPTTAEPGDVVSMNGTGVGEPLSEYRAKLASSAAACPGSGQILGGVVLSDGSGNLPATSRTIPTNTTSGTRYLCFAGDSDPADYTAPTPLTIF